MRMASYVPVQPEDELSFEPATIKTSLLTELDGWTRDARAEDNDRYFWHVGEVDKITRGGKFFVIGRKGSGKTAICEYLSRKQSHDYFAERLSFKNFPFNELYGQKDHGYTAPNQFITIWKFVIYSTVCRLMMRNEAVPAGVRADLSKLYEENLPLSRRVSRWVGKEFGASLFGLSGKIQKTEATAEREWIQRVNFLEDFVLEHLSDATYFILFDELDEDYREIKDNLESSEYIALITSLFKAVHDVRSTFASRGGNRVRPIVFLRDDIYELVRDADKNKWRDFRIDISWDEDKIRSLLAFRISRALDAKCKGILPFDTAWQMVFGKKKITGGGKRTGKQLNSFDYIARSTLLRPRDFVAYVKSCAEEAIEEGGRISPQLVRRVDRAFSNYLRDEFTDEIFAVLPDISAIFDVIVQLRKWNFSAQEFETVYRAQVAAGSIKEPNVTFVMKVLYHFSVIGNSPQAERFVFRYTNRESQLNLRERIIVHRGLFKSLQIL